jgi:hypothetical protein
MKIYKNINVPATQRTVLHQLTCDLCAKNSNAGWGAGAYEVLETEVRCKTGSSYPEGGSDKETTIDICPTCFTEKLVPWVKSQGGAPTVKERDW